MTFEWIESGPVALAPQTGARQGYILIAELMRGGKPIPHDGELPAVVVRPFWDNEAKAREEIERDKRVIEARYGH